jgi:hypothetical protein
MVRNGAAGPLSLLLILKKRWMTVGTKMAAGRESNNMLNGGEATLEEA